VSFSGVVADLRYAQISDTTANWSTNNPILENAEIGWDETVLDFKIGDGVTAWNSLPYYKDTITAASFPSYEAYQTGTTTLAENPAPASIIPMNTQVDAVTGYAQVSSGVQVTDAGSYNYAFSVSADGGDNDRATLVSSIYVNGIEVTRTRAFGYCRNVNNGEGSAGKSGKLILSANDIVTVRAFIFGDNATTITETSNLFLERKS